MRVNFNFLQPTSTFINAGSINRGLAKNNAGIGAAKDGRRDKLTLSPQGKAMNAIKNLTLQKDSIVEQKSELIGKTLENGGDMKSIKVQLDTYEKQMKEIDKQIAQITADQIKKAAEKEKEKSNKSEGSEEGKTKEQLETQRLSKIASVSGDIKDAKIISSAKRKTDGEIRVKETEVKIAQVYIDTLESRGLGGKINVEDMINHAGQLAGDKLAEVSVLSDRSAGLETARSNTLGRASGKLEEGREADPAEEDRQASAEDEEMLR